MSDGEGAITDRFSYDAFGRTRAREGLNRNPYQFTGQQVDAETGLVYLRARYYDPALGRFLSRDPVLTEHPYAYVGNNPANLVDPSGMSGVWPFTEGALNTITGVSNVKKGFGL